MLDKLLGPLARRWSWVATALAVQKRFTEVRGGYLAAAVALSIFLAVFPLLLVVIAVIGLITENNTTIVQDIIDNLGLSPDQGRLLNDTLQHASETKKAASVVGLLGLAWSGLGVVAAIEYALDATWQVTGRSIKDKLRGLVWGAGALLILGTSIAVTAVIDLIAGGPTLRVLSIAGAVAINVGFWMWTFWVLSFQRVDWRKYLPGALLAGAGLEIVKQLASIVPGLIAGSSPMYGQLAAVFGVLAALVLFARLVVYASVLNVVRWEDHRGTVTVEVETPRLPGVTPVDADRSGAINPQETQP